MNSEHNCTAECTAGWSPGGKCHCTECGRNFGSLDIFDRHRKHTQADDQCLDPRKFRDVVLDAAGVFRHRSTVKGPNLSHQNRSAGMTAPEEV